MKEHFSSRVTKLLVILALAIVASVMFVFVGCGETHVHAWTESKEQAATCTEDGWVEYTCEGCGDVRRDVVQATGHTWDSDGTQGMPATCTEDGWYYYRHCTVCGSVEASDRIAATGHTIDFKAATTKVTMPNCTTAGSVTGVCVECGETVTYTSAQIAADKDANGLAISIENQPKANTEKEEFYGTNNVFLGALGHDYRDETHMTRCEAIFTNQTFNKTDKNVTDYYWNYCDRCKTAFEVEKHTVPDGYLPCENAKVANSTQDAKVPDTYVKDPDLVGNEYADAKETYAYQCTACKNYLKTVDHSYKLMSLKSGTANEDDAVWEAAPADAEFSCLYYEVCEWCSHARISKPHTPNMAKPTCTEDVVCEVCHKIVESATGHVLVEATEPFGDIEKLTIPATCTTGTITYKVCEACRNREMQGEDVTWVLGENYESVEAKDALGHTYNSSAVTLKDGKLVVVDNPTAARVYDESVDAVGCARPFWYQDVCSVCKEDVTGHIRVAEKPTVYTKDKDNALVPVTDATLKTDGSDQYFFSANDPMDAKDVEAYNAGAYYATEKVNKVDTQVLRAYTDSEGRYAKQNGGAHIWVFQTSVKDSAGTHVIDYEHDTSLTLFEQPTCKTPGMVLYRCSNPNCGEYAWRAIDLETYANAMDAATADNDSLKDYYVDYKTALATQRYHEDTMFACGHHECSVCTNRPHEVQYTVSFRVTLPAKGEWNDVTAPVIANFYGWTCYDDRVDKAKLNEYIAKYLGIGLTEAEEVLAQYTDFTYTFSFKDDENNTVAITDPANQTDAWADFAMPKPNGDAQTGTIYIDVVATPVEAYTIVFTSSSVAGEIMANSAFAPRTVYRAEADKSQTAPVYGSNKFTFTNAKGDIIDFAKYNWNKVSATDLTEITVGEVTYTNALVIYVA